MSTLKEPVTIAELSAMAAPHLRLLWQKQTGTPPPPTLTARLMRHALAWQLQAKACTAAELSKAQKDWARIMIQRAVDPNTSALPATAAKPGTRLLKEWGGATHEVVVEEDGVLWNGRCYGSLSAVARAMTGTSRNGPKFFGLRS
ncbi:MAG: DUF2924 domain-containing protein [Litoreibacter sp.]